MLTEQMKQYVWESQAELKKLICDLCAIPAPSHQEGKRAAFCKSWFERQGLPAYIDKAQNAVFPWGVTDTNDVIAVMAHTDTVFPDLEPMPLEEKDGKLFCPGVTDDTAQLAVLMLCARYLAQHFPAPARGVLFVANSCEEGLGNLKGSKQIVADHKDRLKALVTLDGSTLERIVNRAVGSHRYQVTVRTEGGHSYNAFGNRNAIHVLSRMIDMLYSKELPQIGNSKTTYNVGTISGGTSVNTIAQQAQMLYEYRSDDRTCLDAMQAMFEDVVQDFRAQGFDISVELLGERPCGMDVDDTMQKHLETLAANAIFRTTGKNAVFRSGSTDCNAALGVGIPAVCISGCIGGGCHTRQEYLELESTAPGCCLVLDFLTALIL